MNFCDNCGAKVDPNAKFCVGCGQKLIMSVPAPEPASESVPVFAAAPTPMPMPDVQQAVAQTYAQPSSAQPAQTAYMPCAAQQGTFPPAQTYAQAPRANAMPYAAAPQASAQHAQAYSTGYAAYPGSAGYAPPLNPAYGYAQQGQQAYPPYMHGQISGPGYAPHPADIAKNKAMACLAYILALIFIPLTQCKDSSFVRFHANRALVLYIFGLGGGLAVFLIGALLAFIPQVGFILTVVFAVIGWILMMCVSIFGFTGMMQALKGKAKKLPLIGGVTIIKY